MNEKGEEKRAGFSEADDETQVFAAEGGLRTYFASVTKNQLLKIG